MLAVRVAGSALKREGYGKNIVTGNDVDDREQHRRRPVIDRRVHSVCFV